LHKFGVKSHSFKKNVEILTKVAQNTRNTQKSKMETKWKTIVQAELRRNAKAASGQE